MTNLLLRWALRRHPDSNSAAARSACGKMAGAVGIAVNLLLFLLKTAVGILAHSVSVAADAVNNLTDASGSLITLLGFRLAERPADARHPYGYARIEYLSGLLISGIIVLLGVELAKSSVGKILHPQLVTVSVPFAVALLLSILIKLWLALFYRKVGKQIESATVAATAADSRNDMISTAAVLLGAWVGSLLHVALDGYFGLAVALFIVYSGLRIGKSTLDPLLGESVSGTQFAELEAELRAFDKVLGVHDLMLHDYGPGRKYASVHVEMDVREPPLVCHDIIDTMERAFWDRHQIRLTVHYDPIVTDDAERTALYELVRAAVAELAPDATIHDFRLKPRPGYTELQFDLVTAQTRPEYLDALRQKLDEKLAASGAYKTAVTFDPPGFN